MKVKIELTPYNALAIVSFCREFINEENKDDPRFAAIHAAVDEYEAQVIKSVSIDMLDDAVAENAVNMLTGKSPERNGK